MFYGTSQYDPIHIIAQIASIQAIFYITLGSLFWLLVGRLDFTLHTIQSCIKASLTCVVSSGPYVGKLTLSYVFSSVWPINHGGRVLLSSLGTAVVTAVFLALIVSSFRVIAALKLTSLACQLMFLPFRLREPRSVWISPSQSTSYTLLHALDMLGYLVDGNGQKNRCFWVACVVAAADATMLNGRILAFET